MKTTCAYLVGPSRKIELREQEIGSPVEDQVLVKMAACGVCRGDVSEFIKERTAADVFGHEPAGQVVAVGPWVKGLKEGDWVTGNAWPSFATYSFGREKDLYAVPAKMGVAAALAEPLKCVTTVVRAAGPDFGDVVVVMGGGFMGLGAICALAGGWQKELIIVDPVAARRKVAMELGATRGVDPMAGDLAGQIRELTGGKGADVAIDFAGNLDTPTQGAKMLRYRGKLILAGGHIPQDKTWDVYLHAITVHMVPPMFSPDPADDWRRAIDAMARGRYPTEKFISHRFKLSEIQKAFETATGGLGGAYMKGIVVNDIG